MNIISRVILGIMGGFMKPPKATLPPPKKIVLSANEAAIVFRYNGAYFVYPESGAAPPDELLDTLDYLRYALERPDWLAEFKEESAWINALTDLETAEMAPRLEVIEGGLASEPELGPFAKAQEPEPDE